MRTTIFSCSRCLCVFISLLVTAWSIGANSAPLVWGTGNWGDAWTYALNDWDGDGVLNAQDAFPLNPAEWLDTDGDSIGNNADLDDDNDNVPDYIDADPLSAAIHVERTLLLNDAYKGSAVTERAAPQ
jgi:hypothetical protein